MILLTPPVVAAVFLVTRRPGGVNDARRLLTTWGAVRVLAALILVAAGYMGLLAVGGANSVKKGERPFDFLGLLPWSDTEVASVEWTARPPSGTAPLPSLPRCVIRVGESSATERLYDSSAETLSRLPQAMVKVTARPSRDKC